MTEHTPTWHWGDGWKDLELSDQDHDEGYATEKYLDLALYGPDGLVIPLRIDHYEPLWDVADESTAPEQKWRDFIATACNSHDALLEACTEALDFIDSLYDYRTRRLNPKEKLRSAIALAGKSQGGE